MLSNSKSCLYMYIYCHPQTELFRSSGLFSVAKQAGIETRLTETPIQDSNAQPRVNQCKQRKFKRLYITFVFVYIYPLDGYRELNSIEEPCFTLVATITSLARELNRTGVKEHIYYHPQTDPFRSFRTLQCG